MQNRGMALLDSIIGSNMSVKEKLDVLDLIIDVLLTHEMMLDAMIGRLEGVCYNFGATSSSDEVLSTKKYIEKLSENPIEMVQEG
jgi:hypothetical protein